MALFDLGDQLQVSRTVKAGAPEAYALAREVLRSYAASGYRVRFTGEQPPLSLAAEVSDRDGTRIGAAVTVREVAGGSELSIQLLGQVFVGGMKAMIATDAMVRQVAKERLLDLIEEKVRGLAPRAGAPGRQEPATTAPAATAPATTAPASTAPAATPPAATAPAATPPAATPPGAAPRPKGPAAPPPHRYRDPLGASLDPEAMLQDVVGELTSLAGAAAAGMRAVLGPGPRPPAPGGAARPGGPAAPSLKEKLQQLQDAHAAGVITDEELRRKREELLRAL